MSSIRGLAWVFTTWNFARIAPGRNIAPFRTMLATSLFSGFRLFSSRDDSYKKAKIQALYCNHPNCDNWDKSKGLTEPKQMKDHWKKFHKYDGEKFCDICGNCIDGKLPCKSFPPTTEYPRMGGKDPRVAKEGKDVLLRVQSLKTSLSERGGVVPKQKLNKVR